MSISMCILTQHVGRVDEVGEVVGVGVAVRRPVPRGALPLRADHQRDGLLAAQLTGIHGEWNIIIRKH